MTWMPPESALRVLVMAAALLLGCEAAEQKGTGVGVSLPTADADAPDPTGCRAGNLVYHPGLGRCVGCVSDGDCAVGWCHPGELRCVSCYTDEHCGDGVCAADTLSCVQCTKDSQCPSGRCDPQTRECEGCGLDSECDDQNPCTRDVCADGVCRGIPEADGTPCDAGGCSTGDLCAGGLCRPGTVDPLCTKDGACASNADCAPTELCAFPKGTCAGAGRCTPRPAVCANVADGPAVAAKPVCGCDGQTWASVCQAQAKGVSVAHPGPCCQPPKCAAGTPVDTTGDGCPDTCPCPGAALVCHGGTPVDTTGDGCPDRCGCKGAGQCGEKELCLGAGCSGEGVCAARPDVCPQDGPAVCGCDKAVYGSECLAHAAGVRVGPAEACCPVLTCALGAPKDTDGDGCPDACPCASNAQCGAAQLCVREGCGAVQPVAGAGLCRNADVMCAAGGIGAAGPVCGCDAETYASRCAAWKADAAVASPGACCAPPVCVGPKAAVDTDGDGCPDACPCTAAAHCPDAEYCQRSSCALSGVCAAVPAACAGAAAALNPVCGCDGGTYDSECGAFLAGTSVAHAGACCLAAPACPLGGKAVDTSGDGCPDACQCIGHADCQAGAFCLQDGCSTAGTCASCTAGVAEVCACDGMVYADGCKARAAGVAVAKGALCCPALACPLGGAAKDTTGDGCPDTCACTAASQCAGGAFCRVAACGQTGVCAPCAEGGAVACACDGKPYPGACAAKAAGKLAVPGDACCPTLACGPSGAKDTDNDGCPDTCLCLTSAECPADQLCSAGCGGDLGKCTACAAQPGTGPFCDCQGATFDSLCSLAKAGSNLSAEPCCAPLDCPAGGTPTDTDADGCPDACTCTSHDECAVGAACRTTGCGPSHGTCAPCGALGVVCGCSGKTWETACLARAAGDPIAQLGTCPCPVLGCGPGEVPVDTTGDGCPDTCAPSCAGPCDCYDALGAGALPACGAGAGDAYWGCVAGACDAQCGAVPADAKVCLVPPTCTSHAECGDGWMCEAPCSGGQAGTCVAIPVDCSGAGFAPVCGCDGVTYKNDCERRQARVRLKAVGECVCPVLQCDPGTKGIDLDADGCLDVCVACGGVSCVAGSLATDVTGDGCPDVCTVVACQLGVSACPGDSVCRVPDAVCSGAGDCKPKELVCGAAVASVVCGCDGKTWPSACDAAAAGVAVAAQGSCVIACTVAADGTATCPAGRYCEVPGCDATVAQSVCLEPPLQCTDEVAPVCGCDGVTYTNDCLRRQAKSALSHAGACECPGTLVCAAGTVPVDVDGDQCPDGCEPAPCTATDECGSKALWCERKAGECGGAGVCAARPTTCESLDAPVCGCDGVTYANGCAAAAAGATTAHTGACVSLCGGADGTACPGAQWSCELPAGACDSSVVGKCEGIPEVCVTSNGAPVCGCDHTSYASDCHRRQAGVALQYAGACKCVADADCAKTQYCRRDGCGDSGTCVDRPLKCAPVEEPVCACSGKTFPNACEAGLAGATVATKGACVGGACTTSADCGTGLHCTHKTLGCDGFGQCGTSVVCSATPGEVCGCDGVSYPSECDAAKKGIAVAAAGACP